MIGKLPCNSLIQWEFAIDKPERVRYLCPASETSEVAFRYRRLNLIAFPTGPDWGTQEPFAALHKNSECCTGAKGRFVRNHTFDPLLTPRHQVVMVLHNQDFGETSWAMISSLKVAACAGTLGTDPNKPPCL